MLVGEDVAGQIAGGDLRIKGVMIESHLVEGRQDLKDGVAPVLRTEYYRRVYWLGQNV